MSERLLLETNQQTSNVLCGSSCRQVLYEVIGMRLQELISTPFDVLKNSCKGWD